MSAVPAPAAAVRARRTSQRVRPARAQAAVPARQAQLAPADLALERAGLPDPDGIATVDALRAELARTQLGLVRLARELAQAHDTCNALARARRP